MIHPLARAYLAADAALARHYADTAADPSTSDSRAVGHTLHAERRRAQRAWIAAGCPMDASPENLAKT